MPDLKHWESIMRQKREHTPWRKFLMEICSWWSVVLHRYDDKLSKFPKTDRKENIITSSEFEEIREDFVKYGIDYNPDVPFLDQFTDFFRKNKFPSLIEYVGCENIAYSDAVLDSKNVYLSFGVISDCENILYSIIAKLSSKNVINSCWAILSENVYFGKSVSSSFKVYYSKYINNCNNIWFGVNLSGCSECIRCSNLDNKSYCIDNKEYTKEEYFQKKKEILSEKDNFMGWYQSLKDKTNNFGSHNVTGIDTNNSENVEGGYMVNQVKNGRNLVFVGGDLTSENMYDIYGSTPKCENVYGVAGVGMGSTNVYNSLNALDSTNIYYSYFLEFCSHCIGCIGLKNKSYCIFNKQYTKEERYEKANEIFAKMEKNGTLGDSLPGTMNPFYFNDTMAYLIDDSFTKEEVEVAGYMWRDKELKVDISDDWDVISTDDLSQYEGCSSEGEREIDPEIMKKVIRDKKGNYYRIVKMEYDFLMKHGLPLPRLHWLDRIRTNFKINK